MSHAFSHSFWDESGKPSNWSERALTAVTESGKPWSQTRGVTLLETRDGEALFLLGSGTYRFRSPL